MIRVEHERVEGRNPVTGVDASGVILHLVIDRPEKRNALTADMMFNLRKAKEDGTRDPAVRVVLVRGEGPVFCAGFDLDACRDDPLAMRSLLTGLSNTIRVLRGCSCVVVMAAQGAAIAGGCALLGGADFVVTDANAKFGYPVTRIGVSPAVSSPFLRAMVGDGHARARLLDSELITGRDAARIGLAHECMDSVDAVVPRAIELARTLALKPTGAIRETKRWLNLVDRSLCPEHTEGALHASMGLAGGHEERSMLQNFWEKTR
ncbi:MAG: enoyl-CoA hydratase/isomerase family protein [Phycisphaerales bacterium]